MATNGFCWICSSFLQRTAVTGGDAAVLATWLLAVAALARWSPRNGGAFFPYRLVTGAALGLAIGSKWNSVVLLGPDFLQLGSDWGSMKQGEFNGPAVNHCAGRAARRA